MWFIAKRKKSLLLQNGLRPWTWVMSTFRNLNALWIESGFTAGLWSGKWGGCRSKEKWDITIYTEVIVSQSRLRIFWSLCKLKCFSLQEKAYVRHAWGYDALEEWVSSCAWLPSSGSWFGGTVPHFLEEGCATERSVPQLSQCHYVDICPLQLW